MALIPFALTALASVLLSLLVHNWFFVPNVATLAPLPPTATPAPTLTPTTPAPPPTFVPAAPDERILSQQILDLQAADRRLWSAMSLLRAANQIDDAEKALQVNDFKEVERILITVKISLDRAYTYADVYTNPIDDFRAQVSRLRDDLRIRPENLDQRLRGLRQQILSLAESDA